MTVPRGPRRLPVTTTRPSPRRAATATLRPSPRPRRAPPQERRPPRERPLPLPRWRSPITEAPPGTKAYSRETLLGTVPGTLHVPRGIQSVKIRLVAEDRRAVEVEVTPDGDHTVAVPFPAAKAGHPSTSPAKTRPKDLEPF